MTEQFEVVLLLASSIYTRFITDSVECICITYDYVSYSGEIRPELRRRLGSQPTTSDLVGIGIANFIFLSALTQFLGHIWHMHMGSIEYVDDYGRYVLHKIRKSCTHTIQEVSYRLRSGGG